MTRVLHITRDFPPRLVGGISTAVGGMVEALGDAGVDCAVISFDDWRPRARPGSDGLAIDGHVARLSGPGALEAAAAFASDIAPTHIHVHHSMLWPFAARLRAELDARAVKSIHVAHGHQNRLRGLEQTASSLAQSQAIAEADAVIAPSPAAAEVLLAEHPSAEAKLSVIPLGIRNSDRADRAARCFDERVAGRILYAGRFADINGTQELFDALPVLLRRHPEATAVIAGGLPLSRRSEAKWRRRWEDTVPSEIARRVELVGWLSPDELCEQLATCAVAVSPSWFETFGLVVLEAMLHGAPIAASRSGGVESMLEHDDSGWLFEPRSVSALVDAVSSISSDRQRAARLGARAANVARATFLWSSIVRRVQRVYDSVD